MGLSNKSKAIIEVYSKAIVVLNGVAILRLNPIFVNCFFPIPKPKHDFLLLRLYLYH